LPAFILSLDQGTTSSRAIIFDKEGNIVSLAQKEFTQYYPQFIKIKHPSVSAFFSLFFCSFHYESPYFSNLLLLSACKRLPEASCFI